MVAVSYTYPTFECHKNSAFHIYGEFVIDTYYYMVAHRLTGVITNIVHSKTHIDQQYHLNHVNIIFSFRRYIHTTPSRSCSKASGVAIRSVSTSGGPLEGLGVVGGGGNFFFAFLAFPFFLRELFAGAAMVDMNTTDKTKRRNNTREQFMMNPLSKTVM